jgi:putative phosphoribosyl transferase
VAAEVAAALHVPLEVILVRKLGVPVQPELAMGAIGEDGVVVVNESIVRAAGVPAETFSRVELRERAELEQRAARLRVVRPRVSLEGRTAVIVDDGIATGSTARAAAAVARAHGAARVVIATPVAPPDTVDELHDAADAVIAEETPTRFYAIGEFYKDFRATSEDEVVRLLAGAPS